MNIRTKDTNLLLVFQVLLEELNASRAAERLSMSQPAMSHALKKLRHDFGDPLFVRKSRGLSPTPKALSLGLRVRKVLEDLESVYQQDTDTDQYLQQARDIVIYTTDYMQSIMLPGLLALVAKEAPNVRLIVRDPQGSLPSKALEAGGCDIAIAGYFSNLPDTYFQQKLLEEKFVTLACRSNTHVGAALSLESFLLCPHVITTLTGDLNGIVEKSLQQLGKKRRIIAGVPSFIATNDLVVNSNNLVTCLESLGKRAMSRYPELVQYACPLTLPKVQVFQVWHKRTHKDRLLVWLRQKIYQSLHLVHA